MTSIVLGTFMTKCGKILTVDGCAAENTGLEFICFRHYCVWRLLGVGERYEGHAGTKTTY